MLFAEDEKESWFYVKKQPATDDEIQLMRDCMDICPMGAIRDDGDTFEGV